MIRTAPVRPGRARNGRRRDDQGRRPLHRDEPGAATLASFGVDVGCLLRSRRKFAGSCLDWTQRRPHLNGALGAAITSRLLQLGWIERGRSRRSVRVTRAGQDGLAETFGWSEADGRRSA